MARYVDVDVLIKNIVSIKDLRKLSTKTIGEAIDKTPIVVGIPEMICRCGNCQFVHFNKDSCTYHCKRREYFSEEVKPTDFCSYGKPQQKDGCMA